MSTPSELPDGIYRVADMDPIDSHDRAAVVRKLLHTREVRQLLANLLPEVLNVYAGKSRFKKFMARRVGNHLNKSLSRSRDGLSAKEVQQLFEDPQFVENLVSPLPDLVNGLFDLMASAVATIEGFETAEKKALLGELVSKMANGQSATLLTRGCRILNDIHADDPEFFAKILEPGFRKWIEAIDFGELKEMVDNSAKDVRATVEMANRVIWQYPAKVVLLLSLIPSVVNQLAEALDISAGKLNELPPDLLTDVIVSFVGEIDSRPLSRLANELTELLRKIHTGSGLIGEPGAPQLPKALTVKIDEMVDQIDPDVLWKARMFFAETRITVDQAVFEAVSSKPDFLRLKQRRFPELANLRFRALNQKLAHWEAMDDREMADAVAGQLAGYDVQEIADLANNALRLLNRFAEQKPQTVTQLAHQFASAVDDYELGQTAAHLFDNAADAFEPAARAVVPKLVQWVCRVLEPQDDEYEQEAELARQALQELSEKQEA